MPAARDGDIATVKRLLTEERVDVNVQDGVSTIFVFFVMEDKVVFEAALWSVRSRYSSPPPPPTTIPFYGCMMYSVTHTTVVEQRAVRALV